MENLNWIYILYLSVGVPASINLFIIARKDKSLPVLAFGTSLTTFLCGVLLDYGFGDDLSLAREWGDLIAITTALCGLFIEIRESKPVFARFPIYLTLLPFLSVLFYPLVIDSVVIKNLLQLIYQGGAILVAVLVISINQFLHKKREYLLTATIIFLLAYISFWFFGDFESFPGKDVAKIVFSIGIIIASIGFKKASESFN
ncbi:MAG: hypothetical protein JJ971_11120 [Balneolaceae bacterium]|nr:hypothetical protein [Balneolaceae bacterium]MBO6546201.1 hypothetical protein [Balneolaceae bacterium]MBO6648560.1 hypothetical protein [Balneolaceae bacterium]